MEQKQENFTTVSAVIILVYYWRMRVYFSFCSFNHWIEVLAYNPNIYSNWDSENNLIIDELTKLNL